MRYLFAVRFKAPKNGSGSEITTKSYRTVAKDSKSAAKHMRKKGQIVSVRKVKKVSP